MNGTTEAIARVMIDALLNNESRNLTDSSSVRFRASEVRC